MNDPHWECPPAQSSQFSMHFVDLSLCAHAYSRECVLHFHPFAASIQIAQAAHSRQICQFTCS
jgi:hypothetical protein